jgi:NAD kinase
MGAPKITPVYLFKPGDRDAEDYKTKLTARFGGVEKDRAQEANVRVPLGGDGSLLHDLPNAEGKLLFPLAIPSPGNTSTAYTLNRLEEGEDLLAAIEGSSKYPLYSLEVDVEYQNGATEHRRAFSTLSVVYDSGQAALLDITGTFNGVAKNIPHLIGDGVLFSTPLGSTGQGYSHGGPILNIGGGPLWSFTGMGLAIKQTSIVAGPQDSFAVNCLSPGKRALRINFDGTFLRPVEGNSFTRITVGLSQQPYATLGLKTGTLHPFKKLGVG